jgi:hypothetical protein
MQNQNGTVNIFAPELRKTVRCNIDFIPGAWVEFYTDVTVGTIIDAQKISSKNIESSLPVLISTVASWNLADANNVEIAITLEGFKLLPMRLLDWLNVKINNEVFSNPNEIDKKKDLPANSLEPSPVPAQ